ncbi:hypothetical protein J2X19_001771 [Rhodoferax ferrireducens]|uniref:Uncharacterized protein n=2 Tax=Rhodoferax ferrireducens TaxID=192843 RepID=A0ABU2C6Z5_9BURK|nr:hypothetical protein [Rhodoferax ferrireducens]
MSEPADPYYGGLGREIWQTDLKRRNLALLGAKRTNEVSFFNGMLWPIGGAVALSAVNNPSASLLRNFAAFSLAAYGLMNSGIPGRDKLYLEAARRMACAMALASSDLYLKSDIEDGATVRRLASSQDTLEQTMLRLQGALENYDSTRTHLLATLETRKAPVGRADDSINIERRWSRSGGTGGAGAGSSTVMTDFSRETLARSSRGHKLYAELSTIHEELRASQLDLAKRRLEIEAELTAALNNGTPLVSQPVDSYSRFVAALKTVLAPTAGASEAAATAQGAAEPWEVNEKTMQALTPSSRAQLITFVDRQATDLERAIPAANDWIQRVQNRRNRTRDQAAGIHCSDALFADTQTLRSVVPALPASAASASGTPNVRLIGPPP